MFVKFEVCIPDIIMITTSDEVNGGTDPNIIRIGTPGHLGVYGGIYNTSDQILIQTNSKKYVLFTNSEFNVISKINRKIDEYNKSNISSK